jgi:hypothetical protein
VLEEKSVEVARRSSSDCEVYNVLRCSSAYRITLVESEAYKEIFPLKHPYPEDPTLPITSDYPDGSEGSVDRVVKGPTPPDQSSSGAPSGESLAPHH